MLAGCVRTIEGVWIGAAGVGPHTPVVALSADIVVVVQDPSGGLIQPYVSHSFPCFSDGRGPLDCAQGRLPVPPPTVQLGANAWGTPAAGVQELGALGL